VCEGLRISKAEAVAFVRKWEEEEGAQWSEEAAQLASIPQHTDSPAPFDSTELVKAVDLSHDIDSAAPFESAGLTVAVDLPEDLEESEELIPGVA